MCSTSVYGSSGLCLQPRPLGSGVPSSVWHLGSTMCCAVLCWVPPPMQEEQAKRAARAKKFGLPEERAAPLQYAPDPEDLKRAQRAKKFGAAYEPPSADTLLQKAGGAHTCMRACVCVCARERRCTVWLAGVLGARMGDVQGTAGPQIEP